ncbi:hypothetical protein DYB32_007817 [Aphanomyces invadans]|uniref:Uncharacterized protein n=1 Tax=Aphanomyces invadans TaxID=157072 RepID=A0A418AQB4_9STRA|nr:hypothetical protein DYB32_007817 [Aphanomyces invadans]
MSVSATTGAAAAPPPRGSTPGTAIEGASSSGANGVAQTPAGVLKYGQTLRLLANSHYHPTSAEVEIGIGVYKKKGKHGILNAVPPLGDQQEHLFQEDEYRVLDPSGQHAEGSAVQFGHTLVLVNQDNLVWNNKTGGITGYVGPRPRQTNGEMYVSFHPNPKLPQPKSLFIRYGDEVVIDVEDANRHVRTYNKRLTNFKKPTSSILGGYICCDGKGTLAMPVLFPNRVEDWSGHDLLCAVVPPRLQIKKVFVRGKTLTSYQFGQPIDISSDNATVEVQFTHDKKVVLTADKLNDMAVSGRVKHYVPLADGGPGGVQMTLQITTPSASTSDATSNAAPASSSLLESLTAKLRGAPVHQVSILVVISSVVSCSFLAASVVIPVWRVLIA